MRRFLGLFFCLSLSAADISQLRELYQNNRIVLLHEALQQPGRKNDSDTLFYRAVVESRFGNESAAIEHLRQFLATRPEPALERKADEELAGALTWIGRYGDSARALAEALKLTPPDDPHHEGTDNERTLRQALSAVPPQNITFGPEVPIQAKHNRLGSWNVPVQINGTTGLWIFDTGANMSTITESEAARMKLATRESVGYVKGSTGAKNSLRIAVARELRFGNARVSNVIFLVIAGKSLYIEPMKYQITGILGLPVIRALGKVEVSPQGLVRIEHQGSMASSAPNMFYDGLDAIVETRHSAHRLQMLLDTGANESFVYPSFRDVLTKDEIQSVKRKQDQTAGAGRVINRTADVIPTLRFEILGQTAVIKDATLYLEQPSPDERDRDGVLGMDGLSGGFTLDFRNMQLSLLAP